MRRSVIRILLLGWFLVTFIVSLRLFSTSNAPFPQQQPNRAAPEDPLVLHFQSGVYVHPLLIQAKDIPAAWTTTIPRFILQTTRLQRHDAIKERRQLIRNFKAQVPTGNRTTGWEDYFRFKNSGSGRIWPEEGEMEDRILNQIHLIHSDPPGGRLKKILLYQGLDSDMVRGQGRFLDHRCPVNQCTLTDNMEEGSTADAILYRDFVMKPLFQRPPNQIWILFLLESAVSRPSLEKLANVVNWTATYRTDSTIVTPYERFTPFANYTSLPAVAPMDYARGKTKKVAWFVSNCGAPNGRHNYVNELKKYIAVDIYGLCGTLSCYRGNSECNEKLRQYKFYLAFENSNCVDYITEKIYWNALGKNLSDPNNVVPVVMGARREDYARLAPPHSYIHVDDFESPKALAEYLLKVDKDDYLYNSYFRWKGTGDFIDTKFWCRLCAMVHEAERTKHHQAYDRLHEWWVGEGVCVNPTSREGWASWRNSTTQYDHNARYVHSWEEMASPNHRQSNPTL